MTAENISTPLVTCLTNAIGSLRIPQIFHQARLYAAMHYFADTLDTGSTVKIARLPKGASIVAFLLRNVAWTGAVTLKIGDSGDDDRYVTTGGITSLAAAGFQFVPVRQGDYTLTTAGVYTAGTVGWGYILTETTDIIVTTEAAAITGDSRMDIATIYAMAAD